MEPHISFQPKCGLELQCQVHSSSDPSVSWYHNDLLLQPDDGVTIWSLDNLHVLQISSCDHSIIGHFSCEATNNLGGGQDEADIHTSGYSRSWTSSNRRRRRKRRTSTTSGGMSFSDRNTRYP